MDARATYDELCQAWREAGRLASCAAVLEWDEQTGMPPGGVEHRSQQLALLARLTHERRTDPRLGERLAVLEERAATDSDQAANLREIRRLYDRAVRLPPSLVAELAQTTSQAQHHWIEARKQSDFNLFQPWLERIVSLKQQVAACLGYVDSPYDPLLEEYEPGASSAEVRLLFDRLREPVVRLVEAIVGSTRQPPSDILKREYPIDRQRLFAEVIAARIGFDFRRGRLDITAHPFCTSLGPGDCRITTRFQLRDFGQAFFGVLHEVGHGLYEQGLDPAHFGTPLGEAVSLGVHESQSRLWENAVGRSHAFWSFAFPLAQSFFPAALRDVALDDFHFAVNEVRPSLIRVEADEVTYNLHIFIRFELEQALITGTLRAADLPEAWNQKYAETLHVVPANAAEGCLQDIHWSAGLFGYFPTYALGNLYGAQLFAAAQRDLGDFSAPFARGEFAPLLDWLRQKVHRHGQRYRAVELVKRATGAAPTIEPLLTSLGAIAELYGVSAPSCP